MDRVVDEASNIYSRYGADDLDLVAERLGIAVYDLLEAEHLKEVYFPELKAIAVKPGLPAYERRYLIAHALGHHVLHREGPARDSFNYLRLHLRGGDGETDRPRARVTRAEQQADLFAMYLLVPDNRLRPALARRWVRESADPVLQLALEFQVPVEPMRVRLVYERCRDLRHQR